MVKFVEASLDDLTDSLSLLKTPVRSPLLCIHHISTLSSGQRDADYPVIYEPLNHSNSEIQIIRLQPGGQNDTISHQLQTHSLNYKSRYNTLSCTWGNPKSTKPISVDGKTTHIAEHLFVALKSIRYKRNVVMIWADALCIDQNNVHEKNSRVAMMDRIYSQGKQTWISLGFPDEV